MTNMVRKIAALAIAIFALTFLVARDQPFSGIRIAPERFTYDAAAFAVVMREDYSSGSAIFTRKNGASLTADLGREFVVDRIELATFNYGSGDNRVSIQFDATEPLFLTVPGGPAGRQTLSLSFTPRTAQRLTVQAVQIGQDAFVFDHFVVHSHQPLWHYPFTLALLALACAAVAARVGRLVVEPSVSTGMSFVFVDMMRGLAALLVLLHHTQVFAELPTFAHVPLFGLLARNGNLGVEIFFFVSAYTLTLSVMNPKTAFSVSMFWLRRGARILPAFFFVMACMLAVRPFLYADAPRVPLSALGDFFDMTYVLDVGRLNSLINHSAWWSISTEMQFYAILPLVLYFLRRRLSGLATAAATSLERASAFGLAVLGFATAYATQAFSSSGYLWAVYTVGYHADMFGAGVALALVFHRTASAPPVVPAPSHLAIRLLATIALVACIFSVVALYGAAKAMSGVPGIGLRIALAAGLALIVVGCHRLERRGLFNRSSALRSFGILSFVVYLVHVPALQLVQRMVSLQSPATPAQVYSILLLASLSVILVLALAVHRLIEAPVMSMVKSGRGRAYLVAASQCYIAIMVWSLGRGILKLVS